MPSGWIKLHRKLMDSPMWTGEPFTKGQAWVDLLMLAQYEDYNNLRRGCVYKSKKWLAARWKWNEKKVARFLSDLESGNSRCRIDGGAIRCINRRTNGSVVTVANWEKYQGDGCTNGRTNGSENGRKNGHQNKNIRNIASEGGHSAPSLAYRASDGISYRKVKNADGDWEMVPVEGGDEN